MQSVKLAINTLYIKYNSCKSVESMSIARNLETLKIIIKMEAIIIQFEGINYNARLVSDNDGQIHTFCDKSVEPFLLDADYNYLSTKARYFDESITYYLSEEEFNLSDKELLKLIS